MTKYTIKRDLKEWFKAYFIPTALRKGILKPEDIVSPYSLPEQRLYNMSPTLGQLILAPGIVSFLVGVPVFTIGVCSRDSVGIYSGAIIGAHGTILALGNLTSGIYECARGIIHKTKNKHDKNLETKCEGERK